MRTNPTKRVIATTLLSLALASLLGAPSLELVAKRQGYGTGRDIALHITEPLASLSHSLYLDRPREWLASATGHEDPPTAAEFTAPPTTAPQTTTTTTTATVPPTTAVPRRVPTKESPLKIWMGGDSLIGPITNVMRRYIPNDPVSFTVDIQVATGLARPDVFEWTSELSKHMRDINPDVVILSFGGNDDQPMHTPDGGFARIYTPEWQVEYARRVGIMMDIALGGGSRTVIWLGLPVERPEQLNTMKDKMNAAAVAEAAKRQHVLFADLGKLVNGPGGAYADDLVYPGGEVVHSRERDGVHLTDAGAALVVPTIFEMFAHEWHLR